MTTRVPRTTTRHCGGVLARVRTGFSAKAIPAPLILFIMLPMVVAAMASCDDGRVPNAPPIADAGVDQEVAIGALVTLNGRDSSDPEGVALNYHWSVLSGPSNVTILGENLAEPQIQLPSDSSGTWYVELIVDAGGITSKPDWVRIISPLDEPCGPETSAGRRLDYAVLCDPGGRVDFYEGKVVFDRPDPNDPEKHYDLFTMDLNGCHLVCLTCDHPELPNRHQGQPAWHPSGRWIVFQSEKTEHPDSPAFTTPGGGAYNDLWLFEVASGQSWLLRDAPLGSLHPHFSSDGTTLTWTEKRSEPNPTLPEEAFGFFVLAEAEFNAPSDGEPPSIGAPHFIEPLPLGASEGRFYENHGLSPDGKLWLFTAGNPSRHLGAWFSQIYVMDTRDHQLTRLTQLGDYNEHAIFSLDGTRIIYASHRNIDHKYGLDYWSVAVDGSDATRLTYFNDPTAPEYIGDGLHAVLSDHALSDDGEQMLGFLQTWSSSPGEDEIDHGATLRFDARSGEFGSSGTRGIIGIRDF